MKETALISKRNNLGVNDILVVDDTPDNLRLLSQTLVRAGYTVRCAVNGKMAFITIKTKLPDLILLDINMPDMDGLEICRQLKQSELTQNIPVIFVSALDEVFDKVEAFQAGGVDYISKPFQIPEVLSRVSNQLKLQNLRRQLVQKNQLLQIEIESRIAAEEEIRQLNFELERRVNERTSQLSAEIHQRQLVQQQLEYLVWNNALTELPNRLCLIERLKQIIGKVQQNEQQNEQQFALIILDCNRFKIINDSLGRQAGDKLLNLVSKRLQQKVNAPGVFLAHFGEDKFAILIETIKEQAQAIAIAKKVQQSLMSAFSFGSRELFLSSNMGIAIGNTNYLQPEEIFRDADLAIQKAKKSSSQFYQIFNSTIKNDTLEILELETDLRNALKQQEFYLNYQPIICFQTGKTIGFETLVRWVHSQKGFISPGKFIPIAEQTNLILPLGMWILQEACQQIKIWQDLLDDDLASAYPLSRQDFTVSVNISGKQFEQEDFIAQLDRIVSETQIDIKHLKLEITESLLMNNAEVADRVFDQLKARKIQLAIDDFGTGYSSLSYLDRFPVDTLKIDRSFVNRLDEENQASTIVKATLDLAHNLGFNVVAEGVETAKQSRQLKAWGCEFVQGYFYAKPLDCHAAWKFFQEN